MKEIKAYVRPTRLDAILDRLEDSGVRAVERAVNVRTGEEGESAL